MIERVDHEACGVFVDTWQLWETPNLLSEIPHAAGRIYGLHVADSPATLRSNEDRFVPGEGVIPLVEIVGAVLDTGYDGWIDVELEIEGDVAHTETYFLVLSQRHGEETTGLVGGRYLDRLERPDGEWRIALRVVVIDVAANAPARAMPHRIAQPRQDRSDPSYQRPLQAVPAVDPPA